MSKPKNIALVAHDNCKKDMVEWVQWNWEILKDHKIVSTGTTGRMVAEALASRMDDDKLKGINIKRLKSGPFGGDQQMGALIAEGKIDVLIFFWDPMEPHPHEVDVKALERISVLYNIPVACNRSTADFIISSELFKTDYKIIATDYSWYLNRKVSIK
jgi:methylglyoxal synthase